jgi:non-specific protein-tyrosine kinase
VELKEYIAPLRKWWWLIVVSTLVATVSSYLATRQQPPIYQSRTTIMVGRAIENPNPSGNDLWLTQQLANTYADIAKRSPIKEATMAALGLTWLPEYTVRVVANTQLLEIAVVDTSPQRAQAVAAEFARQLIRQAPTGGDSQTEQRQAFITAQLNDLEAKIKETQAEVGKKQDELTNMFSARQIADAQTQIAGLQSKLTTLQANYAALLANTQKGAINTISVVEPAALPTVPIGPNKLATILLAAAIGLVLAGGAAYLLEYLDDTLKNPDDVQKVLSLTTLGAVPRIEDPQTSGLVALAGGQSAAAEAYRILRTNLQFAEVERPLRTLLITSPAPSEGKSLTTANLAVALAQAGRRVVVVDADLHRPRQHRVFALRNNVGLTSALLEARPALDDLLQETTVPGLRVLTSGPLPPNAAELLGSARMKELLAELTALADIVVLDSPPATALSDAAILSTQCDGVLLVLDSGSTRREVARRAVEALRRVNTRVIGALLNRMPLRGGGSYYYYYYYYYGHYYSDDRRNGHGDGAGGLNGLRRRLGRKGANNGEPIASSVNRGDGA